MNGLIGLTDVAEILGMERARQDRCALRVLRRLERVSGHTLLIQSGEGNGSRYLVIEKVLRGILDGHMSECAMRAKPGKRPKKMVAATSRQNPPAPRRSATA